MALNFKNQKPAVDQQVRKALRSLLDMTPRKGSAAVESLAASARPKSRLAETTHTGEDKATKLGFVRARGRDRSNTSIGDIIAQRSDAVSGCYHCCECGTKLALTEAWRNNGGLNSSLSVLFCESCAMRVRVMSGLDITPIQMSEMDQLNMGQFVPRYGIVAPPAAPLQEATAPVTAADKWASSFKK